MYLVAAKKNGSKTYNQFGYIPKGYVELTNPKSPKQMNNVTHQHYMTKDINQSLWKVYSRQPSIFTSFTPPYITHTFTLFSGDGIDTAQYLPISRLVYTNWNLQQYFVEFIPSFYLSTTKTIDSREWFFNTKPELDRWSISPEITFYMAPE
jgi:hypothetical protein